ncbi:MAG: efflux RND transporter periplasmic adaptor subunit [Schwartzia sp.]|nr:efflux RND transporter periplasmic adaptor subunit [Schwartzia sp. (in: firmicutes)]
MTNGKKKLLGAALSAMLAAGVFAGCGGQQAQQGQQATPVKAMKVLKQDTPLTAEFAGQVRGKDEVKILPRVSGAIMEKYVEGGQFVDEGQPLYRIDSRQYEAAVLSAQADLARAQATLDNAMIDLRRDEELLASDAISEQTVTTQRARVHELESAVDANAALLQKAYDNLDDTLVRAPLYGRLDVNDVAVGTYAVSGQTTLVTVGNVDPVYVQFSISEAEYLKYFGVSQNNASSANDGPVTVSIKLTDGSMYPQKGRIVQADRALSENTGTLTLKALFPNPSGILLPGMFARVRLIGETAPNAILVPQRAIQQVLDKTFVLVVGEDGKSQARNIELGEKVGSYYIIRKGVTENDTVIVEGLTRLQDGMELAVTTVTPEQMGFTVEAAPSVTDR